ncbi:hypothetical protein OH799_00655 [Nocardia sp. NBC_00881]|uniref:hypothetical protein n=1 Tax=Nocardia sp. NBC_00881 TaxID=2975995 RepID=UPI003863C739|nr:hypothetical protein OH799_00655 [Nocardia sp. NBC_00881]
MVYGIISAKVIVGNREDTVNSQSFGRAAELLRELHDFGTTEPYRAAVSAAVLARISPENHSNDDIVAHEFYNVLLNHRLDTGYLVVEQFVVERDDLSDADRTMLLGWRNNFKGLFEIKEVLVDGLRLFNHIDELTYAIRTARGEDALSLLSSGMLIIGRLASWADEWIFMGSAQTFIAEAAEAQLAKVPRLQRENPDLVFRNPAKLAEGWKLQAAQRADFIAYHGSDTVMVHGSQAHDAWTVSYRQSCLDAGRAWNEEAFPPLSEAITGSDDVTLIFDEVDGLSFYVNYATVRAVFADPDLVDEPPYRDAVVTYLHNDAFPPVPLARLAAAYPHNASRLFAKLLRKPDFSWERDGDNVLRKAKARWYAGPRLPRVVPISTEVTEHIWPRAT